MQFTLQICLHKNNCIKKVNLDKGPHTNQFIHAKRPMDIWREEVKGPDVFKIFVLSNFFREFSARNSILQLSFAVYFVSAKEFRQQ